MPISSREAESPGAETALRFATERVDACPLCGSAAARTWRTDCRDWLQPDAADRFEYARCTRCDARFLAVRPIASELDKVYFAGYGPYQAAAEVEAEPPPVHVLARVAARPLGAAGAATDGLLRRRLSRLLESVYTPASKGDSLVDYGCGTATFLDGARRRGWHTVGVDFSDAVLAPVRARGHAAFLAGEEFEAGIPDESVACVRMNHVVEHLYEPRQVLERIRTKMRPGARLHIATPNPGSAGSRLFGRHWWGLECPRHVVLYRPRVLQTLLVETGFREPRIVHEASAKDLARSWGIRLYAGGRIEQRQIVAMAGDSVRLSLAAPAAALTALASVADRYHVFARA